MGKYKSFLKFSWFLVLLVAAYGIGIALLREQEAWYQLDDLRNHFNNREWKPAFQKFAAYSLLIHSLSLPIPFLDIFWTRIAPQWIHIISILAM